MKDNTELYIRKKKAKKINFHPASFKITDACSYSQLHKPLLFNEESVFKQ